MTVMIGAASVDYFKVASLRTMTRSGSSTADLENGSAVGAHGVTNLLAARASQCLAGAVRVLVFGALCARSHRLELGAATLVVWPMLVLNLEADAAALGSSCTGKKRSLIHARSSRTIICGV